MKCVNKACRLAATMNFGAEPIHLDVCAWCWRILHERQVGGPEAIALAVLDWWEHQPSPVDISHIPA